MKTLYLDTFSGISGDMFIGALLDLGVDFAKLSEELAKLRLQGYHLHFSRQERGNIAGIKFDVHFEDDEHHHADDHEHEHSHDHEGAESGHQHQHVLHHQPAARHSHEDPHVHNQENHRHESEHQHGRTFAGIRELITRSSLSDKVKRASVKVFQRLADAEGKIHGKPPEEVHFHEVGAIDSIVDIVGACICLDMLGNPRVLSGAAVEGVGTIHCAHGIFPLPAPATLEILSSRGISIAQCEEPNELITPTGAALLAELADSFGPMPLLSISKIGYGLGTRQNQTRPNVLRVILAQGESPTGQVWESDRVAVLETNLDDINPELLGDFVERALANGALDVFHTAIQMKKNRPGILLTVLCAIAEADKFTEQMLRQTSAFGVRRTIAERRKLEREIRKVETGFGTIEVKVGRLNGKVIQAAPEFDSCKKLADQLNLPLKQIYEAAIKAIQI